MNQFTQTLRVQHFFESISLRTSLSRAASAAVVRSASRRTETILLSTNRPASCAPVQRRDPPRNHGPGGAGPVRCPGRQSTEPMIGCPKSDGLIDRKGPKGTLSRLERLPDHRRDGDRGLSAFTGIDRHGVTTGYSESIHQVKLFCRARLAFLAVIFINSGYPCELLR